MSKKSQLHLTEAQLYGTDSELLEMRREQAGAVRKASWRGKRSLKNWRAQDKAGDGFPNCYARASGGWSCPQISHQGIELSQDHATKVRGGEGRGGQENLAPPKGQAPPTGLELA